MIKSSWKRVLITGEIYEQAQQEVVQYCTIKITGDMNIKGIDELDDLLILFTNNNLVDVREEVIIPENIVFHQNYSTPFNPATKIKFQV